MGETISGKKCGKVVTERPRVHAICDYPGSVSLQAITGVYLQVLNTIRMGATNIKTKRECPTSKGLVQNFFPVPE